jgi:2-oxoglutarate ferredoxin oxidoreductase subunit gamma
MIIMSQGAYEKYIHKMSPHGILLIDDELVTLPEDHRDDITTYGISATKIASESGTSRAANTAMLGFWTAITRIITRDAMRQSIADSVPTKTIETNLEVFDIAYQQGMELKQIE